MPSKYDLQSVADRRDVRLGGAMPRAVDERRFEIAGKALNQLVRTYPTIGSLIPGRNRAAAFRNLLIHGDATIDHETVWRIIQENLPTLRRLIEAAIQQAGGSV